jgi:serine protease Do
MRAKALVGALAAAGIVAAGAAGWSQHLRAPMSEAHASALMTPAAVAAPAANPAATALPLNGFTELVATYGPAVVNVSVTGSQKVSQQMQGMPDFGDMDPDDPFFQFFKRFQQPGPKGRHGGGAMPMRGQGSGFIVSPDGYIITNAHVVDHADEVSIRLTDRREYRAKVIGIDKTTDIAVLKIDAKNLPVVKVGDSRNAKVGEWVVAIGSPFGFENSVTAGIVSAKSRSLPDSPAPFLQTDVAVNPGNSGGPLFNLAGDVIGVNSQIYSRSGGYQGVSFAIPIEVAMKVKDQLVKHGHVTRGRLGVVIQEVNATLASSFGLDRPRGALVASVDDSGAAAKAGVQVGDIILKYNGNAIEHSNDLPLLVADTAPGEKATMEVWRKGAQKSLTVAVGNAQDEKVASNDDSGAPAGKLGVSVRPLTQDERKELGKSGVLVEQVTGAAERAGVQPGDVVLSLNGNAVKSPADLRDLVAKSGKHVALLIQREDRQLFVPIELG